ncbi:hypothetical protein [Cupriavidus pinatubonensis]|uniref:hypothetical protein n=1 Tax=Cupriavidus pinatubonensis TaxID=248026 RepID=UPI002159E950|nr:hypothetical protein [Cupriavidus pinatubonensis]
MVVMIVAVIMIVAMVVAMVVAGTRVIVAAAFAANVFVWQCVFRCRASHFFFPAGLT